MSSKVCLAQHEGHIFIVLTAMTPGQVRSVQESFQLVAPYAADAACIFYEELFRIAPDTRDLFPDDLRAQRSILVQMLAMVVKSLGNVGQALLSMLRRVLGPHYTEEVQDAWSAAYNMLARLMLEAASMPHATGNFFGRVVRGVVTSQYGISEVAGTAQAKPSPKPFTAPIQKIRNF
jgi:hemoglobin-like flavoprotein